MKARAELRRQIAAYGWSGYRQAFRRTSDVTTLTAFTEDAVALVGLSVALVGITAARVTGNPIYDAAGAVVIDVLLVAFALLLAAENKRLIVGESLSESVEDDLREVVASHDAVVHVDGFPTMFVGAGEVLVTMDVSFDPDLDTGAVDDAIGEIKAPPHERDDRVQTVYVEPEV